MLIPKLSDRLPFGRNVSSPRISLRGHHHKYVRALSNGGVDCQVAGVTEGVVCEVVQVKPDTVAFRSQYGKFLSGVFLFVFNVSVTVVEDW
mgnify:CR=1 FL=1